MNARPAMERLPSLSSDVADTSALRPGIAVAWTPTPSRSSLTSQSIGGRLDWLDGIRGLAALYVVALHAMLEVASPDGRGSVEPRYIWLIFGQQAVILFIALSGFSLMLRVARTGEFSFKDFARRRAMR